MRWRTCQEIRSIIEIYYGISMFLSSSAFPPFLPTLPSDQSFPPKRKDSNTRQYDFPLLLLKHSALPSPNPLSRTKIPRFHEMGLLPNRNYHPIEQEANRPKQPFRHPTSTPDQLRRHRKQTLLPHRRNQRHIPRSHRSRSHRSQLRKVECVSRC